MSNYVDSVLAKGEVVKYRAHVSWWSHMTLTFFGGLFMLAGLVGLVNGSPTAATTLLLGVLLLLPGVIALLTTELVITDRRIIAKKGLISRDTIEINLSKVEALKVQQGVFGRLLGYGTVVVCGTGATQSPVKGIKDPLSFRRAFDSATE